MRRARTWKHVVQLLVLAGCLWPGGVRAASAVAVTVGSPTGGVAIPSDFVGLSFETSNLNPETDGQYIFTRENRPLVTLFRNIGIKSLRIGGGTAEPKALADRGKPKYRVPGPAEIDRLFAFARSANLKVIYTLRLLNGDKAQDAAIAQYIAGHYRDLLDSFSIGNEPDWHAYHSYPGHRQDPAIFETVPGEPGSAYPSYLRQWRAFAAAVLQAVPDARFSGPDTGSNWPVAGGRDTTFRGRSWTENFAADEQGSGHVAAILAHDYVGQGAHGVSVPDAIHAMLSRRWVTVNYPALYDRVLRPVQALGFPYRLTECNDYTAGVPGASNAFAAALWALDYLHWHAAHGAAGLNFHNKRWIYTDTVYHDAAGLYRINPKAYGLRAFSVGGHGRVAPTTLTNNDGINLTAYAVIDGADTFVTLINKEHDAGARDAVVTITLPAGATHARTMALLAPGNDPRARAGVTLGGAAIASDRPWEGRWNPLPATTSSGERAPAGVERRWTVTVPHTSALIVEFLP